MKAEILALIASNRGRLIAATAAFIVGGIAQLITSWGFQLPADIAIQLSSIAALAVGWAIDHVAARINSTGITKMQDTLPGIQSTGYANKETVSAVRELATGVEQPDKASEKPFTVVEGSLVKHYLYEIARRRPDLASALRSAVQDIEKAA